MNDELVRLGYCRYASKEAADAIADAVGDQMPQDPAAAAMAGPGGPGGPGEAPVGEPVSPETAADVAATLIDAANKLVSETGGAGMEGPEAEALKTSAAQDLTTRAYQQAEAVMFKAAEETYEETAAANPRFKKVYEPWRAFRGEQNLWFRVAEGNFDSFMARALTVPATAATKFPAPAKK
jgi:hypothetical protein